MSRIVLGRVSSKPHDDGQVILSESSFAAATALYIVWGYKESYKYETLRVKFYDVEKPSVAGSTPYLVVSTNGATFETVGAYGSSYINWSATTALTASGVALTANGFGLVGAGAGLSIATASGIAAECHVTIHRADRSAKTPMFFEWHYLNSASSPALSIGSGYFASGPILGVAFTTGGVTTYTGKVALIGSGIRFNNL